MKVAAVQMTAGLGDVEGNIRSARHLAGQALAEGAEMVILPEFFTSAMGFHPVMKTVARPLEGTPLRMLQELAETYDAIVGGSFIVKGKRHDRNTFVLVFPDQQIFTHSKDQPTMWENCYYRGGSDDGVLATPAGNIGAALCWEFVRTCTARRMAGEVDLVVGGSCWWTLPAKRLPGFNRRVDQKNQAIMREAPSRFARLLGCPVIHAAHAGVFRGRTPLLPGFPYDSYYLGQTQIVDGQGHVKARMEAADGEGFVVADIEWGRRPPGETIPEGFWIFDLPPAIQFAWWYQNLHGKWYYWMQKLFSKTSVSIF